MLRLIVVTLLVAGLAANQPDRQAASQISRLDERQEILWAEDRRAPSEADVRVLTTALNHPDHAIQRLAVRALGRLERPGLVAFISRMLSSTDAGTRAEAANALAQAVSAIAAGGQADGASSGPPAATGLKTGGPTGGSAVVEVAALLQKQLEREADPAVRGVICESLGRLPYANAADVQAVEHTLVAATFARPARPGSTAEDATIPTLVRAVKGLESLLRQNGKAFTPAAATTDRLRTLAVLRGVDVSSQIRLKPDPTVRGTTGDADPDDVVRVRRLALLALAPHAGADQKTLAAAMGDEQWEVRRIAVRSAGAALRTADAAARSARLSVVMRGLGDAHWRVRYEALSSFGRQEAPECRMLLAAVADRNTHVSLLAIDLLAKCGAGSEASRILGGLVRQLPAADGPWHVPAHALVSLARLAPEQAAAQLERFASNPIWQVRAYAARAAAIASARDVLRALAGDTHDNVRSAAVAGLSEMEQHASDDVYIGALASSDGQLLITAAKALKGTPDRARALPALLQSLAAQTRQRRDTSRDARLALLERIGELGSREQAMVLSAYAGDFDARVARSAAAILKQWTGIDRPVPPPAPPSAPPPALEDVRQLDGATAIVRMKNGGTFTLALLVAEAPASVVRFARLARSGYYNGLTFHRVEPGSLIQGGSPGANEYAGDGPFMRDELGLASNRRGSVGVSTRGRDTGDAQWYINLVDNARYDHNYTVFATVSEGMDIVDAIVEGDIIAEIRIVEQPRTARRTASLDWRGPQAPPSSLARGAPTPHSARSRLLLLRAAPSALPAPSAPNMTVVIGRADRTAGHWWVVPMEVFDERKLD